MDKKNRNECELIHKLRYLDEKLSKIILSYYVRNDFINEHVTLGVLKGEIHETVYYP